MTLSIDQIFTTTEAMQRFGGNFVHYLACALRHADSANREKLLTAFPEIVEKYGPGSIFYASVIIDADGKI